MAAESVGARLSYSPAIASLCSELTFLVTSLCSQPTLRLLYLSIRARRLDHVRERTSKFNRNLRLRLKICGSKFAVQKNEILS
jgi:hypothetical protein